MTNAAMQNPMRILPMAAYCTTVHQNVLLSAEAWVSSARQVRLPDSAPAECAPRQSVWLPRHHGKRVVLCRPPPP